MKIIPSVFAFTLAAVAAAFSLPASAHYLWSENTRQGNAIYFGGVDENIREKSPGKLDDFTSLTLQVQRREKGQVTSEERVARKGTLAFAAGKPIPATASLIGSDLAVPVKDLSAYKLGILKLNFYVRHVQIDKVFPAVLALDAVPTGVPGQLRVSFNGQPLPAFKAKLIAPNGWTSELKTDAAGLVQLSTPWRGNYVIEATYFENTSGEFQGQHFERIRHRLGLTVVQPKGPATFVPDYHEHEHAD
jgi:hypothetical protein